jgi:hypothetical protein
LWIKFIALSQTLPDRLIEQAMRLTQQKIPAVRRDLAARKSALMRRLRQSRNSKLQTQRGAIRNR